jgi:hypothetical protein
MSPERDAVCVSVFRREGDVYREARVGRGQPSCGPPPVRMQGGRVQRPMNETRLGCLILDMTTASSCSWRMTSSGSSRSGVCSTPSAQQDHDNSRSSDNSENADHDTHWRNTQGTVPRCPPTGVDQDLDCHRRGVPVRQVHLQGKGSEG